MVTNSIVTFIVRKGNPKHITTWADLVKSGVSVITPNPFSSGSAKWNIMAAYGAQLAQGKSKAQAARLPDRAAASTRWPSPRSASAALQTFLSGQGDVLLDYEDDALYAKSQGEPVTVVTPPQTILIQNPIAVTTRRAEPGGGQGVRGLPPVAGRPEDLGPAGLPAGPAQGGRAVQVPQAQEAVHHRLASAAGPR